MSKTIATFSFPYEAHIARAKLESEGIPAFVADEHTINMQWLYSTAMGGVRLQVSKKFVEEALTVLNQDTSRDLIEQEGFDTTSCKNCSSTNTEFYLIGKRLAFLVFLGVNFPLYPTQSGIKCNECGHVSKA